MPNHMPDTLDRKILDHLQSNGRMTNQELSDAICLLPILKLPWPIFLR